MHARWLAIYAPSCAFIKLKYRNKNLTDRRTTPLIIEDRFQSTHNNRLYNYIHFSSPFSGHTLSADPLLLLSEFEFVSYPLPNRVRHGVHRGKHVHLNFARGCCCD